MQKSAPEASGLKSAPEASGLKCFVSSLSLGSANWS